MSQTPNPVQLPRITVQHDLPDVLTEIKQGLHAAEDCWVSCYLGEKSVHGKVRLSEAEPGQGIGGVEATAREGVEAELVRQTTLSIACEGLAVPPTPVHFPAATPGTPLRAHGGVQVLAVSPDGQRFVAGGTDGLCRVGPTRGGGREVALKGHVGDIRAVAFFPSNEVVLTASSDMTLRVFSALDGSNPRTLTGHTKAATATAILNRGRSVLSASLDGSLRLWSLAGPSCLHTFRLPQPVFSLAAARAPDSLQAELADGVEDEGKDTIALAGLQDGTVAVVDLSARAAEVGAGVLRTLKVGWSGIEAVAYDEGTGWVAAGTRDGTVALFNLAAPPPSSDPATPLAPWLTFARGAASITSLAFSPHASLIGGELQGTPTLLVGTSDGLPFRASLKKGSEGGEGAVAEEFAGVDCDRVVVAAASGREVWVGAADGKLRRYQG